ncbi:MAG: DUF3540 domain-containing protein [Pseudomonadota bacterium]
MHLARVLEASATALRIVRDDQEETARRAFGCLVEPIAGDRVLVARVGGESYVLSVLDRLVGDQAALSVPTPAALTLRAREVKIAAAERLELSSGEDVALQSPRILLNSPSVSILGKTLAIVMDTLRSVVRRREIIAQSVALQAEERTSTIRGADLLKAGTLVQQVEAVSSTTAAVAVVVAKEDVRLDAKRVTVG